MQYRIVKKEAKKTMAIAKNNACERLYQRLNSKEGENEVFKLARVRERRTRDLSRVRCIKDEDGKILVEDTKVHERWQSYFYKLFNGKRFDISPTVWCFRLGLYHPHLHCTVHYLNLLFIIP